MSLTDRLRRFLPEALLLAGTLALLLVGRGRWVTTISDSGIWYSDLQSLSRGGRLMEAVRVPYGPLSVAILEAACRIFGYRVITVASVNFAFGIATLLLLLRLSTRFLRESERVMLSALAVSWLLWVPGKASLIYSYAPSVPIGLALVLLSLTLRLEAQRLRSWGLAATAGGIGGLAYLTKQEMGVAAAAGLVAASLPSIRIATEARRLGLALLSFAVVVVAGYAWWFRGLPFFETAQQNLLWPFTAIPKAWAPQYAEVAGYDHLVHSLLLLLRACAFLAALASGGAAGWALLRREPVPARRASMALSVSLGGLLLLGLVRGGSLLSAAPAVVIAALVAAFGLSRIARPRRAALLALSAASLPLLSRVGLRGWSESPFAGLGYTLTLPLFVWAVSQGALRPYRGRPREARRFLRAAAPIAAILILAVGLPRLSRQRGWPLPVRAVVFARGTVYAPPPWATALARAASAISAQQPSGRPVLFLPEPHGLDFLLDRRSAAGANKLDVAFRGRLEEDLISRLRADPPGVVVWFRQDPWPFGTEGFGISYGIRLRDWLDSRYAPALTSSGGVSFTLYRPRGNLETLPSSGPDAVSRR